MKIIFLDIDGVMNNIMTWPKNAGRQWIDPKAVKRLNKITQTTGSVIVISSTWRRFWDVELILKKAGVTAEIIGTTPFLASEERGSEIGRWLSRNGAEKFVILDDDTDMGYLSPALIKTEWDEGLQDRHVKKAIARLR